MPPDQADLPSTPTETSSQTVQSSPSSAGNTDVGRTSTGLPTVGEVPNDPVVDLGFEGLGADHDMSQLPSEQPKVVAPPAAKSPAPAAAPVATAPVAAAPAPAAPPANPAVAAPAAEPPASTDAQPVTADAILNAIRSNGTGFIEALTPAFAITEEQAAELETDYATAVPKLFANVYMKSVATAVEYIQTLVPQIIERHMANKNLHKEAEEEFFGKFSGLNRKDHGADIITLAKAFSQANPKITKAQLFDLVGAAVMAKHGIAAGAAPAAQRPQAFMPASNSAPVVVSSTPVNDGLFEGLGREYD